MANVETLTVIKSATVRITHTHRFDEAEDRCRCGKTEAETDGPVQITEVTTGEPVPHALTPGQDGTEVSNG